MSQPPSGTAPGKGPQASARSDPLCPLSVPEMKPRPPRFSAPGGRGSLAARPPLCDLGRVTQLPGASGDPPAHLPCRSGVGLGEDTHTCLARAGRHRAWQSLLLLCRRPHRGGPLAAWGVCRCRSPAPPPLRFDCASWASGWVSLSLLHPPTCLYLPLPYVWELPPPWTAKATQRGTHTLGQARYRSDSI